MKEKEGEEEGREGGREMRGREGGKELPSLTHQVPLLQNSQLAADPVPPSSSATQLGP